MTKTKKFLGFIFLVFLFILIAEIVIYHVITYSFIPPRLKDVYLSNKPEVIEFIQQNSAVAKTIRTEINLRNAYEIACREFVLFYLKDDFPYTQEILNSSLLIEILSQDLEFIKYINENPGVIKIILKEEENKRYELAISLFFYSKLNKKSPITLQWLKENIDFTSMIIYYHPQFTAYLNNNPTIVETLTNEGLRQFKKKICKDAYNRLRYRPVSLEWLEQNWHVSLKLLEDKELIEFLNHDEKRTEEFFKLAKKSYLELVNEVISNIGESNYITEEWIRSNPHKVIGSLTSKRFSKFIRGKPDLQRLFVRNRDSRNKVYEEWRKYIGL